VEKCVTINGHVIDPDGKFVGGATVAPARTGWDNTITGDTRFNVRTADDGSFSIRLPASGGTTYNLLAHDGDYDQWRNWANGVGQPLQTKPGDNLQDVELRLSRPCIVRGRVIDSRGKPVANRSVRTQAPDKDENRYYDTTTSTNEKGEFELRFVRAGEQYVQVEPFDVAERAPRQTWKLVTATPDHSVEDVLLTTEYELVSEPTPYFRSILLPGHEKPALIEKPGAPESSSSDKPVAPSGPTIESQSATKLRHKQSKEDDPSSRDGEGNSTKPWRVYTPFEVPAGSK
jgi:hypothetical protein